MDSISKIYGEWMSAGHAAQNVRQDERGTEKGDSGGEFELGH